MRIGDLSADLGGFPAVGLFCFGSDTAFSFLLAFLLPPAGLGVAALLLCQICLLLAAPELLLALSAFLLFVLEIVDR